MIGWQTFKFKEGFCGFFRIIQIALGYGWTADDDFSLLAIRHLLPLFINDKGRRVRLSIANRQALAILQHLVCHCYRRQGHCCLSRTISIDNASLREAIAQLLSCLDRQLLAVKVEMRQLRQLLAVKVIRQQGHIREGRRRSPDSNRQTENRLKQLLEILSHSRRQGKKSPSQGQSRCPIHDRQVKRIRRLSQHLRTLRSRKLLIRNHPIRKAEQIIVGNLHSLRFASRS